MKLRLRGNTLRLRLSRRDLDALSETGSVTERTRFGPGADQVLEYTVAAGPDGVPVAARFGAGGITVIIPAGAVRDLHDTELAQLEASQVIEGDDELRITLEKDFGCLKPRDAAEDLGSFTHPTPGLTC